MSKKTIQEIAHRTCRKYKHNSPIPKDLTKAEYIFDDFTLKEFVDKLIEESDTNKEGCSCGCGISASGYFKGAIK